jgi:hypothetical protein
LHPGQKEIHVEDSQTMVTTFSNKTLQTIGVLLLLFIGSCARLPEYAQPNFYQRTNPLPLRVITYRDLTKADFQAKEIPHYLQDHTKRLGAHTAVSIRPAPTSKTLISSAKIYGQHLYSGSVKQLSFEAVMIPEESWWNPHLRKKREAYVLQHEQIHFALMEIAARQLTIQLAKEKDTLMVFASSYETVNITLLEKINELIAESRTNILKEHTAFDEDTSMHYTPEVQQSWWEKVATELQILSNDFEP